MKKSDFKKELFTVFNFSIEDLSFLEKINFIEAALIDFQKDNVELDTSNKGKPWTDEELKIILSDAATKQNCIKYAKLFKRSYGSIEQIYRWSTTPQKEINEKGRGDDSFIQQIKRIYKEIGLRS
ncbi:hypothetical protein ACJBYX_07500 [Streptococcus suis]|uniref:hypothetical protein n=1 Tax=Streptococcus suis TaxID=1307 RepID=UPI0011478913|nr:hypothetical protein [Streptococcus suis]MCH1638070.1 hypothetical protein [Streptococcus suis]MCH1648898.1 hypothetical protein [Streptococcus suis]TQE44961.1 hypothetical protein FH690_08640 [Streptococcus suis]HEM3072529.1 hypothetical protein [Streptococcus suis]HEM3090592.1 hypothetical protein [Streptococcus suis]